MPSPMTLSHDAMFYGSDDEFVRALVPFARSGLEHGDAVVAAVTRHNMTLLRDALGTDGSAVALLDRDEWYQRPAVTVAGWQRLLAEATGRGHRHMRLIGEVGFGEEQAHPTWTRYEAALNDVFAHAPAWIVCPYDTRVLPGTLLRDARRTHPTTFHPERRPNDDYCPPGHFLTTVPEPMPPVSGPPAISMAVVGGVSDARGALLGLLATHGWAGLDCADDLVIALSEIVTNSLRHGRGRAELRVWTGAGVLTCEVSDDGEGLDDPLTGYRPPVPDLPGGRGLWIARQLCDRLAVSRRDGATVVRFAVALPDPAGSERPGLA